MVSAKRLDLWVGLYNPFIFLPQSGIEFIVTLEAIRGLVGLVLIPMEQNGSGAMANPFSGLDEKFVG